MKTGWIMLLIAIIFLSGCRSIGKSYRIDAMVPDYDWYKADSKQISLSSLKTQFPCIDKKNDSATPICTDLDRNQATYSLLTVSDHLCNIHLSTIVSNSNTWNVTSGAITNLLAGLASIGSNPVSQAKLAAGAAFSNGTRSLVNSEIYAQNLATTVVRAIVIKRESMGKEIVDKLAQPQVKYPFFAAINDVQKYHNSCSFYVGVSEITRLVESRKDSTQDIKSRLVLLLDQRDTFVKIKVPTGTTNTGVDAIDSEITLLIKQLGSVQQ